MLNFLRNNQLNNKLKLHSILTTAVFFSFYSINVSAQSIDTTIADGKRIYQLGILPNGKPVTANGAANVELSGEQVSCIRCHRRSGFGSVEGDLRIPPILGDILFKQYNKAYKQLTRRRIKGLGARPAYTDKTLAKAITTGAGADQRHLNQLMPRYNLSETDVNSVILYLKSLTLKNEPGITKESIHIATIITPEVLSESSDAMLKLLTFFIDDLNANTRKEEKRATNSPWHKQWDYKHYRKIKLHTWKVSGPRSEWDKQLNDFYNKQNVFAVINGISDNTWNEIHHFCNDINLPCLFPTTELPLLDEDNIYNFYYSGGIAYDAKTIASHIKTSFKKKNITVLQVYKSDKKSDKAVKYLAADLKTRYIKLISHKISSKKGISTKEWTKIIKKYKPTILVSWLDSEDVKALNTSSVKINSINRLYYSFSHLGKKYPEIITANKNKSYLVYRYMLPKRKKLHITRATGWAKRKEIDISNERIIGNAFFAITNFNRAVKKMRAYLNQEYLTELVESMLENNAFQSVYPKLLLGPDQRIASKGAYILGPLSNTDVNKKENHIWIRH